MIGLENLKVSNDVEFDINIKIKTYSPEVMGYRVIVDNEVHYIINSILDKDEKRDVAEALLALDSKYDKYGLIILQKGFRFYIEKDYVYDHKIQKHDYKPNSVSDIDIYKKYKSYLKKVRVKK